MNTEPPPPDGMSLPSAMREYVIPWLRTYPHIKVWLPEFVCAADVFAIAMVLAETGLFGRSRIWATAAEDAHLAHAQNEAEVHVATWPVLRERITFAQHSLETDASFNEFQFIVSGGALVHFDPHVKQRAFELFHQSLCRLGFVAIAEEIGDATMAALVPPACFEAFTPADGSPAAAHKLFRRIS